MIVVYGMRTRSVEVSNGVNRIPSHLLLFSQLSSQIAAPGFNLWHVCVWPSFLFWFSLFILRRRFDLLEFLLQLL